MGGGHIVRLSEPWKSHKNARDTINRVRIDTYFSVVVVVVVGTDLPFLSLSLPRNARGIRRSKRLNDAIDFIQDGRDCRHKMSRPSGENAMRRMARIADNVLM